MDSRDGVFKLLEVNARPVWNNTYTSECGVNQVLTAYLDASGVKSMSKQHYECGVYNVVSYYDLLSIKEMAVRGKLSPRALLKSYTGRTCWTIYSKDDPRPFIQLPYQALIKRIRGKTRITPLARSLNV